MAAQEAVKELYILPWAKTKAKEPQEEVKTDSEGTSADQPPSPSAGKTTSMPSSSSSPSKPGQKQASQCSLDPSDADAPSTTVEQLPKDTVIHKPLEHLPVHSLQKEEMVELPKKAVESPPAGLKDKIGEKKSGKKRVLMARHFEYALKNTSSSSVEEMGALPQLRKVRFGFVPFSQRRVADRA